MKRIEYIMPVDYLRGNISGRQSLEYDGGGGYDVPDGNKVSASGYEPRMVAMVAHIASPARLRYFQVRTKTSVHMTPAVRHNMAVMGGSGAIYAAVVRDKSAQIYTDCVRVCPETETLRSFLFPILRDGLAAKTLVIQIADGVTITNPWTSTGTQTVNIPADILDKFNSELS